MDCKILFQGPLSLKRLEDSSVFVRKAICAALWDQVERFGLSTPDQVALFSLWKDPLRLYLFLYRHCIYSADVVQQFPSSPHFSEGNCDVVVKLSQDVFCKTYVTKYI